MLWQCQYVLEAGLVFDGFSCLVFFKKKWVKFIELHESGRDEAVLHSLSTR
jgi:hypothetical protein